ncbi:MAG: protein kinase, partial [Thermoanaerobaculia bacterium]
MAAKHKSFEQFGPYVLLKKLETDALGDLWRAARIENNALGPIVALRRLTGGNREALSAAAQEARQLLPSLIGPSFARDQVIDVIGGVPIIAHDYATGRTLRYIVDRARGGKDHPPNPIPIDQAIVIAERVSLSLATTAEIRFGGERLAHGGLIPHLVWITDDGEIRVAGQYLAKGIAASLRDEKIAADLGRYFSPEYQHSGVASKSSEVYSVGAMLYLLLTGHEPPDALRASAFTQGIRSAKTMTGTPMPDDIRAILEKSLNLDPNARYASVADIRNALSALSNSGKYSATSFNLAFYLGTLLKKELEAEVAERERESKINVIPYLEALAAPAIPAAAAAYAAPPPQAKGRAPLALAAVGALVAIGVAAWLTLGTKKDDGKAAVAQVGSAATPVVRQQKQIIPEPIVASPSSAAASSLATSNPAAQAALDDTA